MGHTTRALGSMLYMLDQRVRGVSSTGDTETMPIPIYLSPIDLSDIETADPVAKAFAGFGSLVAATTAAGEYWHPPQVSRTLDPFGIRYLPLLLLFRESCKGVSSLKDLECLSARLIEGHTNILGALDRCQSQLNSALQSFVYGRATSVRDVNRTQMLLAAFLQAVPSPKSRSGVLYTLQEDISILHAPLRLLNMYSKDRNYMDNMVSYSERQRQGILTLLPQFDQATASEGIPSPFLARGPWLRQYQEYTEFQAVPPDSVHRAVESICQQWPHTAHTSNMSIVTDQISEEYNHAYLPRLAYNTEGGTLGWSLGPDGVAIADPTVCDVACVGLMSLGRNMFRREGEESGDDVVPVAFRHPTEEGLGDVSCYGVFVLHTRDSTLPVTRWSYDAKELTIDHYLDLPVVIWSPRVRCLLMDFCKNSFENQSTTSLRVVLGSDKQDLGLLIPGYLDPLARHHHVNL
ncbi:hypothetical protein KIPB_001550 [Kipferlia bialata]|uniref:Uncharacterized protein n=1 Tax=Kipferlia bialata TaxID=797122 RepID=A0A9K3GFB7_9EUKA|nr:hypothetical protein KIPB_001550 [Kipferlia bialata]|eukprot:g1550.t1